MTGIFTASKRDCPGKSFETTKETKWYILKAQTGTVQSESVPSPHSTSSYSLFNYGIPDPVYHYLIGCFRYPVQRVVLFRALDALQLSLVALWILSGRLTVTSKSWIFMALMFWICGLCLGFCGLSVTKEFSCLLFWKKIFIFFGINTWLCSWHIWAL